MLSLIAAVTLPAFVACTNCNASGWVNLTCHVCKGSGVVPNPRRFHVNEPNVSYRVPCPKCTKGLIKDGATGTGKVRRTCPVCKGRKKLRANKP